MALMCYKLGCTPDALIDSEYPEVVDAMFDLMEQEAEKQQREQLREKLGRS